MQQVGVCIPCTNISPKFALTRVYDIYTVQQIITVYYTNLTPSKLYAYLVRVCSVCATTAAVCATTAACCALTENKKSQSYRLKRKELHNKIFGKMCDILHTTHCTQLPAQPKLVPRPDGKSQAACKAKQ